MTLSSNEEFTPPYKTNYRGYDFEGVPQRYHSWSKDLTERQDYKLNIDLPSFTGRAHFEEFMDWISVVEKFFD